MNNTNTNENGTAPSTGFAACEEGSTGFAACAVGFQGFSAGESMLRTLSALALYVWATEHVDAVSDRRLQRSIYTMRLVARARLSGHPEAARQLLTEARRDLLAAGL